LHGKIDNFEDVMMENLPKVKDSSLILKFLRTLKLPEEYLHKLILNVVANGSVSDLLAVVDVYTDNDGKIHGSGQETLLKCQENSSSILHTAVTSSNKDIIKFLIKNCSNIIRELPLIHQIEVSTAAFSSNQFDVLCDLLEICDFPFPSNLDIESITDKNLKRIINVRAKLHAAILTEDLNKIKEFNKKHPKIKYGYDLKNKSALCQALDLKKFKAFFLLKALRFQDTELENCDETLSNVDKNMIINKLAYVQRRENVNISNDAKDKSAIILATKALIYNRGAENTEEEEQRDKIKQWFKDIYKTKYGYALIDAVVQCDKLKIIFDFECDSVSLNLNCIFDIP
jgi:hypothetical protein